MLRKRSIIGLLGNNTYEREREKTGLGKENSQAVIQTWQALCHPHRKLLLENYNLGQNSLGPGCILSLSHWLGATQKIACPQLPSACSGTGPRRLWSRLKSWGQPWENVRKQLGMSSGGGGAGSSGSRAPAQCTLIKNLKQEARNKKETCLTCPFSSPALSPIWLPGVPNITSKSMIAITMIMQEEGSPWNSMHHLH